MKEIRNFYAESHPSKNCLLQNFYLPKLLKGQQIQKLNDIEGLSIEGHLTVTELSEALKNKKKNKTEFFKVFWNSLKFLGQRQKTQAWIKYNAIVTPTMCDNVTSKEWKVT